MNGLTELQKLHQEQAKERRKAIKRRKARTHRLIVRGAIAEKMIPHAEDMTDEEFQHSLVKAVNASESIATSPLQESRGSDLR